MSTTIILPPAAAIEATARELAIIEQANTHTMPALPKARPSYEAAKAAIDELFA